MCYKFHKDCHFFFFEFFDRLPHLIKHRTSVRKLEDSNPDRINTQGLKKTEKKELPLSFHQQMVRLSSLLG